MDGTDMTWEDLGATAGHDIDLYKTYRSQNGPNGDFDCAQRGPNPSWSGADPLTPLVGEVFYYLVTAFNIAAGEESHPGTQSDGTTARVVDTASICL